MVYDRVTGNDSIFSKKSGNSRYLQNGLYHAVIYLGVINDLSAISQQETKNMIARQVMTVYLRKTAVIRGI